VSAGVVAGEVEDEAVGDVHRFSDPPRQ
jgi:hypothetical protein